MALCMVCRNETELDDQVAPARVGRCLCLRCLEENTSGVPRLAKPYRRDVIEAAGPACRGHHSKSPGPTDECCRNAACTIRHDAYCI